MVADPSLILIAPLALIVLGLAIWFAHTKQTAFMIGVITVAALESSRNFGLSKQSSNNFISASGTLFSAGPIQIKTTDVVSLLCIVCAGIRLKEWRVGSLPTAGFAFLATVTVTGLLLWTKSKGVQEATAQWREWITPLSVFAYAVTRPRDWGQRDLRLFGWIGLFAVGLLVLETGLYGFNAGASQTVQRGTEAVNGRAIGPAAAMIMLISGWLLSLLPVASTGKRFQRLAAGACFAGVVIAQQRTVWTALLVSAGVWVLLKVIDQREDLVARAFRAMPLGLIAAGGIIVAYVTSPAIRNSANDSSSLAWRQHRWEISLSTPRSVLDWLAGLSFGPREYIDRIARVGEHSAHSFYLASIESVGLLGLLAALLMVLGSLLVPLKAPEATLSITLAAAILASGYSYDLQWVSFVYAGALGAMHATRRRQSHKAVVSQRPAVSR